MVILHINAGILRIILIAESSGLSSAAYLYRQTVVPNGGQEGAAACRQRFFVSTHQRCLGRIAIKR